MVLLGIEDLEERRGGIAPEIGAHLVDFIKKKDRIPGSRLAQPLDDLARHGADIGAPVAADFRFVPHPAEGDPDEFAPQRAGNRAPQGRLADPRRADQAEDRPLDLLHQRLDGQVFEDPLLDLLQAVVIGFEDPFGPHEIEAVPGPLFPGKGDEPVEVVAHHRRLGGHGGHHLQLAQFPHGLFGGFLGHLARVIFSSSSRISCLNSSFSPSSFWIARICSLR